MEVVASRPDGKGHSKANPVVWGGNPENWRASKEFTGNPGRPGLGTSRHVIINEILANSGISGGPKIDTYLLDGSYLHNPSQSPCLCDQLHRGHASLSFQLFYFISQARFCWACCGWGSDAQKTPSKL